MDKSLSTAMFQNEDEKLARFRELERKEIEKNQWYLGERYGHEISWNFAEFDWFVRYRREWLDGLRASGQYPYS